VGRDSDIEVPGFEVEEEYEDYDDYAPYFAGDCTCTHDPDEHGAGSCGVLNCNCEAGWE